MLGFPYYNETIKNAVAVFGSLFNNVVIKRKDGKILPVPIAYGPRSKWLEANKQFNPEEEMFEKLLPRMAYEMVAMSYDTNRKITNKQKVIRTPDNLSLPRTQTFAPVPYTLDFTLYIETKNLNDGWQICEQILPFFQPSYTVTVRNFPLDGDPKTPEPENQFDMPITLTAVTWADDWTGDIGDRRSVEWTMEFSTKIWLYGPVNKTSIILDSRATILTPENSVDLSELSRASDLNGLETGWANTTDSEAILFDSDSIGSSIINISDSDGNIVKVIRDIGNI